MKLPLAAALAALSLTACASDPYSVRVAIPGKFGEVRDAVQFAIEGKGLNINHVNHISEMLNRTGADLGATKQLYTKAEQFEFCSATLSRAMMEADPHAVVMCPYIVSVYQLTGEDQVWVAFRKPPATGDAALDHALGDVEKLLTGIAGEAR